MKKKFIVANWKANPVKFTEAKKLFSLIEKGVKSARGKVVVCPAFVHIPLLRKSKVKLGAQDCFWNGAGAFTGEISPKMLKDAGCDYVILNHSERRKYNEETNEMSNKKVKAALKAGLIPIVCLRDANRARKVLAGISKSLLKKAILVFEPPSAISTNKGGGAVSASSAIKQALLIKKDVEADSPILYGGSVDSKNAKKYIEAGFDGVLVGAASLKAREFIALVKSIDKK